MKVLKSGVDEDFGGTLGRLGEGNSVLDLPGVAVNGSQDENADNLPLLPCHPVPPMLLVKPWLESRRGDLDATARLLPILNAVLDSPPIRL